MSTAFSGAHAHAVIFRFSFADSEPVNPLLTAALVEDDRIVLRRTSATPCVAVILAVVVQEVTDEGASLHR